MSPEDERPTLVIEVLSPQTAAHDRGPKRVCYQQLGVQEVWLVDFDSATLERWRPGADVPEVLRTELVWQPEPSAPPLRLFLPSVLGEAQFDD
jgi:Uma2 family endonuclease